MLEDLKAKFEAGEITLVDVREPDEWLQGHIHGAVSLPMSYIETHGIPFGLDVKPVYIYCRSGGRAQVAAQILRNLIVDVTPLPNAFEEFADAGFTIS